MIVAVIALQSARHIPNLRGTGCGDLEEITNSVASCSLSGIPTLCQNRKGWATRHLIQKGGVTIVYDGDGNRVSETVGSVTTTYLVDTVNPTGYAQVVDELQNGTVSRTYAYGLERIDQDQLLNGTWTASFYGYDGHGSVRQLTNSSGNVTDSYDYDAFGNLINQTGSTPNNYLFAGEQYDPSLGLYYNRARYLNTTTGRFWSMDTDEGQSNDPISLHKYLYTGSNPVDHVDPTGHEIDSVSTFAAAALAVTIFTMAVLQTQPIKNAIANSLYAATTGAGELYDITTAAAGEAMAEAELAIQSLYFSIYDAITKAQAQVKAQAQSLRKKLEDIKVVPISATAMPKIAAHIAAAQLSGYPMELNRTTPEQAALNRAAALAGLPSVSPLSWDEYPFASSVQGGVGASVAPVPVMEQWIQGGTIAASYSAEGINVGDPYWVVVIP